MVALTASVLNVSLSFRVPKGFILLTSDTVPFVICPESEIVIANFALIEETEINDSSFAHFFYKRTVSNEIVNRMCQD